MGIFSKPEVIILKESNAAKDHLDKLESLLPKANKDVKDAIQKEIAVTKAGIAGEDNIMFELKHSNMDMVVLHDINLETKSGLKAQIDFIVVTSKVIFLIECKNLVGNIDIDSKGAFIRTVTYGTKKQKEGIYSPITQGERHLSVLKEAKLDNAGLVTSLAIKRNFDSSYKSLVVLANPKTIVNDRYAPKEIKSQVIRADQLVSNMKNIIAASNDFASTKKEMMSIAQGILDMNIESRKDYAAKYEELVKENELSDSADTKNEISDINGEQAESVIRQLETIGVLGGKNEDGTHTVMMDKDAFINRVRGYQDLAERMRAVAASKNANLSDVTISKKLIIEENDHAVKTRVPGTWGEEVRYVWLRKENIMEIHGGKTMLTFLDSTKDYKLYDEQNRVVTTQKGTELYTHYDKVESSVRERYEKVQKQQKKTTQKKTVTTKKAR